MRRALVAVTIVALAHVLSQVAAMGAAPSLSGPSSVNYNENDDSSVATYSVTNSDVAGTITWSLRGTDSAFFSITDGDLTFGEPPNFENAKDDDGNNKYQVEVVATNEDNESDSIQVTVTVIDVDDPSVVLIMADDVGYEAFGSYGSTQYSTPRLDALATLGVRFAHAYSNPSCTPSRVSIMTGRNAVRNYVAWGVLPSNAYTFAELFDDAGYATVIAGKWQLHGPTGVEPADAGFDSYCLWNTPDTARSRYWNPSIDCNGTIDERTDQDYGPDIFTEHLTSFMETNKDRPFFAYYAMALPHSPFVAPPVTTCPTADDEQCNFEAMVTYLDTLVGRIYDKLDDLGILDNTILIFTSDNGTEASVVSQLGNRVIYGDKKLTTDGGTRVPLIAHVPGGTAGRVLNDLIDFSDFLPTFAEAIGASVPEDASVDGVSFWDRLEGRPGNPREWIYSYYFPEPYESAFDHPGRPPQIANVRDAQYRLYASGELFDVSVDPLELHPIAQDDVATQAVRTKLQGVLDSMPSRGQGIHWNLVQADAATGERPLWRPVLVSATVNGATLSLDYAGEIDTAVVPATSAYSVTVDGENRNVVSVSLAADKVTLTLAPTVKQGQAVTVTYTPGASPLSHADRTRWHHAPPLDEEPVVNQSPPNSVPAFPSEETGARSIPEDTPADTDIGAPVAATDADNDEITYTMSGSGAQFFKLDSATGQLSTKEPLDHESRPSYTLTVTATDVENARATQNVTVNVENLEETGGLTLSTQQPQEGVALRATLDDPDGRLSSVSWQWQGPPGTDLSGATSSSYTPVASDVDNILRATVTYTDGHGPGKGAHADSANPVRAAPVVNTAPEFPATETGTREVLENTPTDTDIGAPVAADDAENDPLTYTLDSTGATFFDIDASYGQLRTNVALDHESRASYRVTVTATDPSGLRDTQQVTITVTNEDEPPVVSGDTAVLYPSGGTRTVATYRADDPERETVTWSLSGPDSSAFQITGGRLGFVTPPDYGAPTDLGGDNVYELTVTAADPASNSDSLDVTVTVRAGAPPPPPPPPPIIGPFFGGGPSGPEPSDEDFEWTVTHDLDALDDAHGSPTGMWSDGATLWLADNAEGAGDAVYAYDLASGERSEEREFALDEQNRAPRGVWSDGATMWVSDSGRDQLFAYDLESGERAEARDVALAARNRDARGAWGGGEVLWVLDGGKDALFAYDLDGGLLAEYELVDANSDPRGIWSDGVTVWVSDHGAKRLYAYRLPEAPEAPAAEDADPVALERSTDLDFTELSKASNLSPRGIWSDGALMYVADANDGKVYTYNMPDAIDARLASLTIEGVEVGEFDPGQREYEGVADEGVTQTTVAAEAAQSAATVAVEPVDADEEAEGHQVDLAGVEEITITVTSEDESRTRTYRVLLEDAGPEPWPHCLRGDIAVGFSLVVYEGGAVDDLVGCAEGRAVTALYALHEGAWVSYILGAPELVNAPFRSLFADGVPALTPLIASSGGPPSPDPSADSTLSLDWPECLHGEVAAGFSLVVYQGGTVEELRACAESGNVSAVYALAGGEWVSYILGAPEFVNVPFGELFAGGVPVATPLVVRSDVAQSTGAAGDEPVEN